MRHHLLGHTGIKVSHIALGTVELGISYGISSPTCKRPDHQDSCSILNHAITSGITLFDTAPAYGTSEQLLGEVCSVYPDLIIATKIGIPGVNDDKNNFITRSLHNSLNNVRRDHLDIVQIHNATRDTLQDSDFLHVLMNAKDAGIIRYLGASVYEPEDALAAIDSDEIDIIQVAYNILDQRMEEILSEAKAKGVGTITRSVYLKGVLTKRVEHLPKEYQVLKDAAKRVKNEFKLDSWDEVSECALRFVISNSDIDTVLVGVSNMHELQFALDAYQKGTMNKQEYVLAQNCAISDTYWINPSNWKMD